jgi:hypothetical protein
MAEETAATRSRVRHDHSFPNFPGANVAGDLSDGSGEFMAEDSRGDDHFGVITPLVDLQVSSTRQSRLDRNAHLAWFERTRLNFFYANVFFAVKNCCFHGRQVNQQRSDG